MGHLLAERKIQTAKLVAKAGMGAGACTLCIAVGLVYTNVARDSWTYLFTPGAQQPEVEAKAETVAGMVADIRTIWPWVMLFLLVDGLYALNGGLMRGLGLQGRSILHRIAQGPQFANVRSSCCSAKLFAPLPSSVPPALVGSRSVATESTLGATRR